MKNRILALCLMALVAVFVTPTFAEDSLFVYAPVMAQGVLIQNLPPGATPSAGDFVPAAQGGKTVKLTMAQLQTFFGSLGGGGGGSGGTVSSVSTGCSLTGGPITTAGTVSLASVLSNTVLGNVSGSTACPGPLTATQLSTMLGLGTAAFINTGSSGATVPILNVSNSWGAGQSVAPIALTDGATITPNFSSGNIFTVTLGGNRALANPTNPTAGKCGMFFFTQDATGSRTLTFGSSYKFSGGSVPTLSTAPNAVDLISYCTQSTTFIASNLLGNFE